jgi:hypothetical protein
MNNKKKVLIRNPDKTPTTFRPSNSIGNEANEHLTTVLPPMRSVELSTVAKQTKNFQTKKLHDFKAQ